MDDQCQCESRILPPPKLHEIEKNVVAGGGGGRRPGFGSATEWSPEGKSDHLFQDPSKGQANSVADLGGGGTQRIFSQFHAIFA